MTSPTSPTSPNRWRSIQTSFGDFILQQHNDGNRLSAHFVDLDDDDPVDGVPDQTILVDTVNLLMRFFNGETDIDFSSVPTPRGSAFHQACWDACRTIPAGETRTYGELAEMAGSPMAARAAGQAMRCNPLPVIVPCHRVVGAGGKLHGYSGTTDANSPALRIKKGLLALERNAFVGAD